MKKQIKAKNMIKYAFVFSSSKTKIEFINTINSFISH